MPTYNKPKLLALLERQRAHFAARRDLGGRARDARDAVNNWCNVIRSAARGRRGAEQSVERLLAMPLQDALALTPESVKEDVQLSAWEELLRARSRLERLEGEEKRLNTEGEHFAIVDELVRKVRQLGFRDPTLEVM